MVTFEKMSDIYIKLRRAGRSLAQDSYTPLLAIGCRLSFPCECVRRDGPERGEVSGAWEI